MKKYFISSDVHSFFDKWMEALSKAGYEKDNPDHIIIHCGDLLDRGDKPAECLEFVNSLPSERKILIRGNHEDLIEECISRGYFQGHDIHNYTHDTACRLTGKTFNKDTDYDILGALEDYDPLWTYLESCVDFAEIGDNIFVHGWIPYEVKVVTKEERPYVETYTYIKDNWKEPYSDWAGARWENGMSCWSKGIKLPGKTIYCGHYHTSWGHAYLHNDGVEFLQRIETMYIDPETGKTEPHARFDPFIDEGIVAIDGCTALTGVVNVVKLEM